MSNHFYGTFRECAKGREGESEQNMCRKMERKWPKKGVTCVSCRTVGLFGTALHLVTAVCPMLGPTCNIPFVALLSILHRCDLQENLRVSQQL